MKSNCLISLIIIGLLVLFIFLFKRNGTDIDNYIESNIDYCMTPLIAKGMDSIQAREVCECGLETLFEIEPKLLELKVENWEQLFESNKDKIFDRCPEIKDIFKDAQFIKQ